MKAARKRLAANDIDQSVRFSSVAFHHYNALEQARGENAGPRLTFFKGVLEIMSPSVHHELLKKRLARLIEVYAEEKDIALEGCGSWTLKDRAKEAGLEPDECYVVGSVDDSDRPDFAIEVVWTSGGVSKLEVYRALGVPEVWFWQDDKLSFFHLRGGKYHRAVRSKYLPKLDPALLAHAMAAPSQTSALRAFRGKLRGRDQ